MPDLDLGAFLASFPWTTFLVGALLSLFLMLALKPVARRTGWVDKPNFRKAHKGEIPLIGGWSILAVAVLLQLAAPAAQRAPLGYWAGGHPALRGGHARRPPTPSGRAIAPWCSWGRRWPA